MPNVITHSQKEKNPLKTKFFYSVRLSEERDRHRQIIVGGRVFASFLSQTPPRYVCESAGGQLVHFSMSHSLVCLIGERGRRGKMTKINPSPPSFGTNSGTSVCFEKLAHFFAGGGSLRSKRLQKNEISKLVGEGVPRVSVGRSRAIQIRRSNQFFKPMARIQLLHSRL